HLTAIALPAQNALDAGDCPQAIVLHIGKTFTCPKSPEGPGQQLEIESRKHDPMLFEKEHNTIWYKFRAPATGMITMEIKPMRPRDDYDFIIFKAKSRNICTEIREKTLQPVLSNISRTSTIEAGRTGLRPNAGRQFVPQGPGDAYSRPLAVTKGEIYYIVVDNVYDGGEGHTIRLELERMLNLSGQVLSDVDGKPLPADIVYENKKTGEILLQVESDPTTGAFDIDVPIENGTDYNLIIHADSHFFKMKTIRSTRVKAQLTDLKITMPKLVLDKAFPLPDINFVAGLAVFVEKSYPTLRALHHFMERNPSVTISLEGHVNGMDQGIRIPPRPLFEQRLSDDRATAVRRYLSGHDIERKRMSSRGFGATRMLFPEAMTQGEMGANRRVEVRMGGYHVEGEGIKFEKGGWEAALAKAKKAKKFLLVDAYTDWCRPCKYMDKHVFADEYVGAYYNPRFKAVKIDMESEEGKAFAAKYPVQGYPSFLFFAPDGELVMQTAGARNQPDFIATGKAALEVREMEKRYAAGERDPEFLFAYMSVRATVGEVSEELAAAFEKACTPKRWYSVHNFRLMTRIIDDRHHPFFVKIYAERDKFYKTNQILKVNQFLYRILANEAAIEAGKAGNEAELEGILSMLEEI
ncbi:MAG: thioredoxin family protein, partial [Bacteroidota bacterium]